MCAAEHPIPKIVLTQQERASGHQEQGRDKGASAVLRSSLSDPLYFSRSSMADPEYSPSTGRPRGMVTPKVNVAEGAWCTMHCLYAKYSLAAHADCMLVLHLVISCVDSFSPGHGAA